MMLQRGKSSMKIYKRFKTENNITLFNGDCYDLLKKISDESVDIIIISLIL